MVVLLLLLVLVLLHGNLHHLLLRLLLDFLMVNQLRMNLNLGRLLVELLLNFGMLLLMLLIFVVTARRGILVEILGCDRFHGFRLDLRDAENVVLGIEIHVDGSEAGTNWGREGEKVNDTDYIRLHS